MRASGSVPAVTCVFVRSGWRVLNILFWNMRGNERAVRLLRTLVREHAADVVILAEPPLSLRLVDGRAKASPGDGLDLVPNAFNRRILTFAQPSAGVGPMLAESPYMTVRLIRRTDGLTWLMAAYHGVSRLENEQVELDEEACVAAGALRDVETRQGHRRTLLVGDMNLNPFDPGMAKARGFFGVMAKSDAVRVVQRVKFNVSSSTIIRCFTTQCGAGSVTARQGRPVRITVSDPRTCHITGTRTTKSCFDRSCCRRMMRQGFAC